MIKVKCVRHDQDKKKIKTDLIVRGYRRRENTREAQRRPNSYFSPFQWLHFMGSCRVRPTGTSNAPSSACSGLSSSARIKSNIPSRVPFTHKSPNLTRGHFRTCEVHFRCLQIKFHLVFWAFALGYLCNQQKFGANLLIVPNRIFSLFLESYKEYRRKFLSLCVVLIGPRSTSIQNSFESRLRCIITLSSTEQVELIGVSLWQMSPPI